MDVETGGPNALDWSRPLQLDHQTTLNARAMRVMLRCRTISGTCLVATAGSTANCSLWPCRVPDHYLTPADPFQGMWMATREQLAFFMTHSYWEKEHALKAHLEFGMEYPDRTTFMNLPVKMPTGYRYKQCEAPLLGLG